MAGSKPKDPQLIFIADKWGEKFTARDSEVLSWEYDPKLGRFNIVFGSKPETTYTYARERVALYSVKESYSGEHFIAVVDGRQTEFSSALLLEPDIKTAPRIIRLITSATAFKDYPADRTAIIQKASASNLFCYLRKIEDEKARGGDVVEQYLSRQFAKLAQRSLEDRAATVFISPDAAKPAASPLASAPDIDGLVIYPFGCNLSQMRAVENALAGRLSLIEGPPGTGKTQTILNIAANLVVRGQSMLIASPNNSATDNVCEKLESQNLGFIVARLGNRDNQMAFLENQPPYPAEIGSWQLDGTTRVQLKRNIAEALPKLRTAFEAQRQLALEREQLCQWELQHQYFLQHFGDVAPLECREGTTTAHLQELRDKLTALADSNRRLGFIQKLIARFAHGIGKWADYAAAPVEVELRIARTIFLREIARLQASVESLQATLASLDADALLSDVTRWSGLLLLNALAERYAERADAGQRKRFGKNDLRGTAVRAEYPIVTSTVNAAIGQCGAADKPFDYVIIDESSQCNLTTGLLALAAAKSAVVVGDTRQLPCVIPSRDVMIDDAVFSDKLDARYRYSRESLLSCLEKCVPVAPVGAIPVQLLAEHYRCHPAIIRYCNQRFYGGSLVAMRDERGLPASEALALIV